ITNWELEAGDGDLDGWEMNHALEGLLHFFKVASNAQNHFQSFLGGGNGLSDVASSSQNSFLRDFVFRYDIEKMVQQLKRIPDSYVDHDMIDTIAFFVDEVKEQNFKGPSMPLSTNRFKMSDEEATSVPSEN